jgi:hypothetical protein
MEQYTQHQTDWNTIYDLFKDSRTGFKKDKNDIDKYTNQSSNSSELQRTLSDFTFRIKAEINRIKTIRETLESFNDEIKAMLRYYNYNVLSITESELDKLLSNTTTCMQYQPDDLSDSFYQYFWVGSNVLRYMCTETAELQVANKDYSSSLTPLDVHLLYYDTFFAFSIESLALVKTKFPLIAGLSGGKTNIRKQTNIRKNIWVRTARKVKASNGRVKTVFKHASSGELRVRKIATLPNGSKRISYIKF